MTVKFQENYLTTREISETAASYLLDNNVLISEVLYPHQQQANSQAEKKLQEIKAQLATGNALFLKRRYREAIDIYKTAQALLYKLLYPSFPKLVARRPEAVFPLDHVLFSPMLLAGLDLVEALPLTDYSDKFGPVFTEVPQVRSRLGDFEGLGVQSADEGLQLAKRDSELGISYAARGQWNRSEYYFKRALEHTANAHSEDAKSAYGAAAINLAAVYINKDQTEEAHEMLNQANRIFVQHDDIVGQAQYCFNTAAAFVKQGAQGRAAELLKQGEQLVKQAQGLATERVAIRGALSIGGTTEQLSLSDKLSIEPRTLSDMHAAQGLAVTFRMPGTGGGWVNQQVESRVTAAEKSFIKTLGTTIGRKRIDFQWKSGDVPPTAHILDLYKNRIDAADLRHIRWHDELITDFSIQLPHHYFYIIPVALGDCYHALGDYETAQSYYLNAANYEYLNTAFELPALWLKIANNVLHWGDLLYKNDYFTQALSTYQIVALAPGSAPPVNTESPLYKHAKLSVIGAQVQAMLVDYEASGSIGAMNPQLAIIVLTIRNRLAQLAANLDFLGMANIVPIWTFDYLQNVARYFAQQAIQAERGFIDFYDRGENESLTRQQLEQASSIASSELELAKQQREAAEMEVKVYQAGKDYAATRTANNQQNFNDYSAMSWERIGLQRSIAWYSSQNPWELEHSIEGSGQHIHEVIAEKTARSQSITRDYELAAMQRQQEEMAKAQVMAEAQLNASVAQLDVAKQNEQIAKLRKQAAKDNLEAFENQFFSEDVWYQMGQFMRGISASYFNMALRSARLMQRAYNFENDMNRHAIKTDYASQSVKGMLAADALLLDVDSFTYDAIVNVRRKRVPVKQTISLLDRYPFLFETSFRQSGRMEFETRIEDFDAAFPGTFARRIESVEVEIIGVLPSAGVRGTLTNGGVSRYRTADINALKIRIQPKETLLLSEYRLREDSFIFPADGRTLKIFEGAGVASSWVLDIPRATNDLDYYSIADIRVTFYYHANYDETLAEGVKAQLATLAAANLRQRSLPLRWTYPDAFFHFQDTGILEFTLGKTDFPFQEENPQLRSLSLLVLTDEGVDPSSLTVRLGVPAHAEPLGANPNAQGEIVAAAGHPWETLAAGPAIGFYRLEVLAADNPAWVADGKLKLDRIRNLVLLTEYDFTPRV
ncbi:hypothetical protein PAECIP111893_01998 [Paenibacillus plantiphilus]|uniref:Tc toxin complex TcA C-terminal TcB-binding domain-containing protein n=1 Tax=Paenibacillus plantiphilus TaxID=2905650 RepID=A0ABN8GEV7_9BACL|nr:hypothetical protein [Paenibacillus plantiphilus]CAH1203560.1 hypothetical protein PAECIP111893_01998 [Paenibacillus plantiphilus]